MTCPYCQREIERYQRPYEVGGVKYHEWCYQSKLCKETKELVHGAPKETNQTSED